MFLRNIFFLFLSTAYGCSTFKLTDIPTLSGSVHVSSSGHLKLQTLNPFQMKVQIPFEQIRDISDPKTTESICSFEVLLTKGDITIDIYNKDQSKLKQMHSKLSAAIFAVVEDKKVEQSAASSGTELDIQTRELNHDESASDSVEEESNVKQSEASLNEPDVSISVQIDDEEYKNKVEKEKEMEASFSIVEDSYQE